MEVVIKKVKLMPSRYGGDIFRIDGYYVDEFDKLAKGYTFIDPNNDNARDWVDVIEVAMQNRGKDIIIDGVRMKKKDTGLWNADSRPHVTEIRDRD